MHLAAAYPNSINKKNLSNIGYKILGQHIEYSDQKLGSGYHFLYKKRKNL